MKLRSYVANVYWYLRAISGSPSPRRSGAAMGRGGWGGEVFVVGLGVCIVAQGCAEMLGFDEKRDFGVPCTTPADCPGIDDACNTRICVSGTCDVQFGAKGKPCDQTNFCDGAGECKLGNALGCSEDTQCFSGFCVDSVCCDKRCAGTCEACSGLNNNGVCTLVAKGADPANECMNGVCNGSSECEYENGHACGVAENCISTFCVVGLCCPTACAQGASCETGACKCPGTNPLECGDICKDGATDNNHCGACDTTCDITNNVGCVNSKCEDLTWAQWPVAEQPAYVVDEVNGTVVDPVTKLMWQREVDGSTYDWQGAKDHCAGLTHAGYDDWRLPTRIELVSIVDYTKTNPAIDTVAFGANAPSGVFWTSSPWAGSGSAAWIVYFGYGKSDVDVVANSYRVRCVR